MDQNLMQAKNVSPSEILNSVNAQNLILPSGTAKIAESELDVRVNVTPRTSRSLVTSHQAGRSENDLPEGRSSGKRRVWPSNQRGTTRWPSWCAGQRPSRQDCIDS